MKRVMYGGLRSAALLGALSGLLALSACGGGGSSQNTGSSSATSAQAAAASLTPAAALGELIFKDPSLSSTGTQSCASCHVASNAHAPANNLAVQLGADGVQVGNRVAPSIRYLAYNRAFRFESDGTPTGGFFWDGRAASLAEQAKGPFLNPVEMANADAAAVVARLSVASYAQAFKAVYGQAIFNDPDAAFNAVALALQAYQKEDADFAPFSSKYDAFLRGQTKLSDAELRGLALFNSSAKGNCAACHPSAMGKDGSFPLFTDFSFDALGVPANHSAPTTLGDLGLCANQTDAINALSDTARAALCGSFKVPSLRNVAQRSAFFHNGRFTDLRTAVTFYVQRDTNPETWYRKADGSVDADADGVVNKYNDLPVAYRGNVNRTEAPYNRALGGAPALNASEIEDLLAFLNTLSDGWTP
jgi:cytochrome c peroxidase